MRYLLLNIVFLIIAFRLWRSLAVELHAGAIMLSGIVLYILMVGFNTYLTSLPIVEYNSAYILGVKIITWPIEDIAYLVVAIYVSPALYTRFLKHYESTPQPHSSKKNSAKSRSSRK